MANSKAQVTEQQLRRIVGISLRDAQSDFDIIRLASSDHAVRVIVHAIKNVGYWTDNDLEDLGSLEPAIKGFSDERAQELACVLWSVGMKMVPEQFGVASKASTESHLEDSMSDELTEDDALLSRSAREALGRLRDAAELLGLPRDFYVRREFESSEQGIGYRPPEIECYRANHYTKKFDQSKVLKMLVEAATDQDIRDLRSRYSATHGPSSTSADAARELWSVLGSSHFSLVGETPYKGCWSTISELLALVGFDYSVDQIRQACSPST